MVEEVEARLSGRSLQAICFSAAERSGWWTDLATGKFIGQSPDDEGPPRFNVPEKLMLIVSELGEAMEGYRKDKMDEHLPKRKSLEVELADVVIRCFDLAGGLSLDLGGAIAEKLMYNASRADHKIENRLRSDGKKF